MQVSDISILHRVGQITTILTCTEERGSETWYQLEVAQKNNADLLSIKRSSRYFPDQLSTDTANMFFAPFCSLIRYILGERGEGGTFTQPSQTENKIVMRFYLKRTRPSRASEKHFVHEITHLFTKKPLKRYAI